MFCFQSQETAKNKGCSVKGVCGKPKETASLQDLLIYASNGILVTKMLPKSQYTYQEPISRNRAYNPLKHKELILLEYFEKRCLGTYTGWYAFAPATN